MCRNYTRPLKIIRGRIVIKQVLITGRSRGIGRAAAGKFLGEGWPVIGSSTAARSPIENDNHRTHRLDLSKPDNIEGFVGALADSGTRLDVLINNAAVLVHSDMFATNRKIACVLSGGSIDIACFADILRSHPAVVS